MALTKITSSLISNNTISVTNIADNAIDATKIASNSILTRHIDDDQITGDQLADAITVVTSVTTPLVDAAILDGENFKVNGGQGTDGQVLTSTGSGVAWEATSVADGAITSAKLDTNIAVAGTLGVTGVLTGTSLDISGDIDVDGTTNLDVVDIDGAVDMASTLTVSGLTNLASPVQVRNATQNFNGGLSTEVNSGVINFGLNEGSANRFGGSYTQANQGGFMHFDTRAGEPLFQLYGRAAGVAGATGTLLFQIDSTGNTVFNETGADADFRVESDSNTHALFVQGSDGSVGIGTSSPSQKIEANGNIFINVASGNPDLTIKTAGAGNNPHINYRAGDNIVFDNMLVASAATDYWRVGYGASGTVTDEHLVVTSAGNVGIGTSSPANPLHVVDSRNYLHSTTADSSTNMSGIRVINSNNNNNWAGVWFATGSEGGTHWSGIAGARTNATGNWGTHLSFFTHEDATVNLTTATERMRIDSGGNVLVGASGGQLHIMNGTTIAGNIGRLNSEIFLANEDTGLRFIGVLDCIVPSDGSGNNRDNAIDWGYSSVRFDDIYATNNAISTSDRNEKQDIEELSEAEQRVAVACKGLLRKFRWKDSVVEKGDEARTHFGIIAQDLQDAFTAEGLDAGDYAMFISTTWWETQTEVAAVEAVEEVTDEEGNVITEAVEAKDAYTRTDTYHTAEEEAPEGATERTRLGVRYSELLAFIIAAI
jgi:hypothetical protein